MTVSDKLGTINWLSFAWNGTPFWTWFIGVMASWGLMNIAAIALEHRVLIPNQQYASFYRGDLFGLPVMLAALAFMAVTMPAGQHWFQAAWWHYLWLGIGLAAGIAFEYMEFKSGVYTTGQILSPTKIIHNLWVFPVMIYWLLGNGLPIMIYSQVGPRGIAHGDLRGLAALLIFIVSTAYWISLIWTDAKNADAADKQAHIAVSPREFALAIGCFVICLLTLALAPRSPVVASVLAVATLLAGLGYHGMWYVHDAIGAGPPKPWAHVDYRWRYILPWARTPWPFITSGAPEPSWVLAT